MTERFVGILPRLTGVILCTMLAACAVTRPVSPPVIRQAERLNARAIAATEQGRYQAAETGFAEAYNAYSAVENHAGMVTVLVNSSRMYRSRGMADKAAAMAARAGEMVHHVPQLSAEVWFEQAKVCLLRGDTACAREWSEKALVASGDENRAMIISLRADIHLKRGEWQRCTDLARESLALSRSAGDRHEEADAHRIMADCLLAGGQPVAAAQAYDEALRLDKELAHSKEVYADLKGLSSSLAQQGKGVAAGDYLLRAADIAIAGGDAKGATADLNGVLLLDGSRGSEIRERLQRLQEQESGGSSP